MTDREQLRLLSVFHYVVAALTALIASIPILHFELGFLIMTGAIEESAPPVAIGCFVMVISAAVVMAGWTLAICMALAGAFLVSRKYHTFCVVVAAASCIVTPFGTVLGIFTLLALMRDSVREMFEERAAETT